MEGYSANEEGSDAVKSRSVLTRIFFTPETSLRLRAGWRILLFFVLLLAAETLAFMVLYAVRPTLSMSRDFLLITIAQALPITLVVVLCRILIDNRPMQSLGLTLHRRSWGELLFGFLLSGILIGLLFIGFLTAGWIQVQGYAWQTLSWSQVLLRSLILLIGVGLVVAWSEELLFRGYLLQNLRDGMGLPAALVVSSLLFGILHLTNPDSNFFAVVGISLAGVLMACGRLLTRQLWFSIGFHAGWNGSLSLLGFPVSGVSLFHLVQQTPTGPPVITGGTFGPEAGLVIIPTVLIGIGCLYLWTYHVAENSCRQVVSRSK